MKQFLSSFNLNLLRVLRALLELRSLTRAGEQVGLTQPAVSAALAKLRIAFDDPLLVPVGRRMELTRRAQALIDPVEEICSLIERLGWADEISPEKIKRNFVIATSDYSAMVIAPKLLRELAEVAPGVSVQFIDAAGNNGMLLPQREIDFFIVPSNALAFTPYSELVTATLFKDTYVFAMSPAHRLASTESKDPAEWAAARYAVYRLGLETLSSEMADLVPGPVALRLQQFSLLPFMTAADCIALVPRRLAEQLSCLIEIVIRDLLPPHPYFGIELAWDRLHDMDQEHRWFRELVISSTADEPPLPR